MEWADHKIRVNAVSPAVVETSVYNSVFGRQAAAEEALVSFNGFHPIGRNGTAQDVANSIAFLLVRSGKLGDWSYLRYRRGSTYW